MSWRSRSQSSKGKDWKGSKGGKESNERSDSKSFQLNKNRFITVSEFKSQIRVDIREYYTDDSGERKPGRKGISLSMEEWNKLKDFLPKIEKAIKKVDDSDEESEPESDHKSPPKRAIKAKTSDSDNDSDDRNKKAKKSKKSDSESDDDSDRQKSKKSKKSISESDSSD